MSKISSYNLSSSPLSLSDMLIGTEVGRPIPLATKNFSLGDLLNFFNSQNPALNLQNVLDGGNTATQDINLIGDIQAGDAEFETLYLTDELLDSTLNPGTPGDVLISTGNGVIWGPGGGGGSTYVFQNGLQQNGAVVTLGGPFSNPAICSDDVYINADSPNAHYFVVGDFYTQIYNGGASLFVNNGGVSAIFSNGVSNAQYTVSDDGTNSYVRFSAQQGFSNASYVQAKGKEIEIYSTDGTYKIGNLPPVENTTSNLDVLTIDTTSFLIKRTDISSISSGTVTSVGLTAGVGISLSGTNPITSSGTITVTNSAPDQVVALTPGTGIGITGVYPNFTITNSSPNQPITLIEGSGINITGSDPNFTISNDAPDKIVTLTPGAGINVTGTYPNFTIAATGGSGSGTVTSVGITAGTGIGVSGTNPITTSGNITITNNAPDQIVSLSAGAGIGVTGTYPSFTVTNSQPDQLVSLTQGSGISITGTYPNFTIAATGGGGTVTSVGLSMPAAFTVTSTPITTSGVLTVTASGNSSQYIRGDGVLADFPTNVGGGSSVSYYLNGSVSQGTFGGDTYYELSTVPIIGGGTNFTRLSSQGDGYIASFITDAGDPALLQIPGGNFHIEFYFSASSGGGTPSFYTEIYKVSNTNVFTLIASDSSNPEVITGGTSIDIYYTTVAVPQTPLLITDRLAIRIFVATSGRDIILYTEGNRLSEIVTTFSTGIAALNGLTAQVQTFQVGTAGSDFGISSTGSTHTFNLPTASSSNRGALSSVDWTTFNSKQAQLVSGSNIKTINGVSLLGSGDISISGINSVTASTPLTSSGGANPNIAIGDAVADGTTKGAATFTSNDFNSSSGVISIDYANGQSASASTKGFLTSADWTTFNNKQNQVSLTTTGSSGASTFNPSTGALNIPQYGGIGGSGFGYTLFFGYNITSFNASTIYYSGAFYGSTALPSGQMPRPSRWLIAPKSGNVVSASIITQLQSTLYASPVSSTLIIRIYDWDSPGTSYTIDAAYPIGSSIGWSGSPAARNDFYDFSVPYPIVKGRRYSIQITTPAWSSAPADVTQNILLFIE